MDRDKSNMKIKLHNNLKLFRATMRAYATANAVRGLVTIEVATHLFLAGANAATASDFALSGGGSIQFQSQTSQIWQSGIGSGFKKDTFQVGFSVGAGLGNHEFGSSVAHDLTLATVSGGWVFSDVVGKDKWYRGNWELVGELFGGAQFHPEVRYVIGLTPSVRYNFMTGSRWVPFVNAGTGIALTDIGNPDLSRKWQLNDRLGVGTHYYLRDNLALTAQIPCNTFGTDTAKIPTTDS